MTQARKVRMSPLAIDERKRVELNSDTREVLIESLKLASALAKATLNEANGKGKRKASERLARLVERQAELEKEIRDTEHILVIK